MPVRVSLGITVAKKIADMCEANEVLVIPHAGQMHNYHVTVSKVPVEVFWYISTAGRSPDGFIDLSDTAPGLRLDAQARGRQLQADP